MSRTDHHRPYKIREIDTPWWKIRYHRAPPQWYRRDSSNGDERHAARAACLQARIEHRASGRTDIDPPIGQHRHRALWYWF